LDKQKTPPNNRWGVYVRSCVDSARIVRGSADAHHRFDSGTGRRLERLLVLYLFSCWLALYHQRRESANPENVSHYQPALIFYIENELDKWQ